MSKSEASKVPQIRFKEFEDGWLEDQLGERVEFFSGLTYSPRNVQKGVGTLVLRSSNVKNGEIVNADNVYVDPQIVNSKNVEVGDIAVVVRNGSRSLIGKHAQIKNRMDNTVIGAFMTGIHSENPAFTNALLDTTQFDKEIAKNLGATINQITTGAFRQMMFWFPKCTEQIKIGTYFQELDHLIQQHKHKHDKLLTLKQAMLQKMFPQHGASTPEIRFKGFKGEWGERSWFETVDVSTDMVDPRKGAYDDLFHIGPGNIESFTGKIYNNVLKVKDSFLISGKFRFNKDDIIYGKINPQLAKYTVAPFDGLASADAYVLNAKNGVVQNYLYVILQTQDFYKYSVSVSARTGMPKINRDELNVYSYKAPDESEQQKIGSYFRQLDELISQHAIQLEKLKQVKAACLEKMFV